VDALLSPAGLQIGAGGLVALIVLMVLSGRLVTRRQLNELRADRDAQLADARAQRDTWQAVAERETTLRISLQATNTESLELNRTAVRLLSALPQPSANGVGVTASAPVVQLPAAPS
jgi:hypothetical protein